ncbi:WD domain-containing protein [Pseudomassariella vexata]|uniref:WD domain-containing protein n=1 Tax=Pseudomassariella vexata TaxID=1141098 RepID=A0A1Y2E055_9PEZI|nr:WD domain-containing protein [Pseudomassariella vexata]ORY64911.1 WD domain-containing protein [Pseudomassariella vexata]
MPPPESVPSLMDDSTSFDLIAHGHRDVVQAVTFNAYGDRCATGSVDGKIRVFNRQKDGIWRMCDHWDAHSGEILELQWLAPTIYPNILASLGIEGRFKLWAEDDTAAPGRRFSSRGGGSNGKAASETRSGKYPYRSFSIKHNEETRFTYFALLNADGMLTVHESEEPESLADYGKIDEFQALPKPSRGEETCFKVRFDPNPDPCYTALRAGVPTDALSLVVSGLNTVRIFRTRDTVAGSFGAVTSKKEFYLAAEITGHTGLVRDVAWAPGNFRGYDIIATACQDGFVRVFRIDTPFAKDDGRSWSTADLVKKDRKDEDQAAARTRKERGQAHALSGIRAEIDKSGSHAERNATGQPGLVEHKVKELSKLDSHRSPVWRVGFDDDGQILGSVGDEGKLMCYRQKPDGLWAKSSELGMMKTKMVAPS